MFSRVARAEGIATSVRILQKRWTASTVSIESASIFKKNPIDPELVIPVSCALGAEIKQVNISRPLESEHQKIIKSALDKFSVLVFRNQPITGQQMVEGLKFLGNVAVEQHYVDQGLTLPGCPECFVLKNGENNPPTFDFWHSDKVSWENPVQYTVLACKKVPDIGGDTLISNNRKAFDSLSEGMKNIFRTMNGVYNEKNAFVNNPKVVSYLKKLGFDPNGVYDRFKDQVHPIVKKNPRNGRESLYFSPPYFSRMEGFSEEESRYFQDILLKTVAKPEFVYRHSWQENDIIIIDNSATSHYAVCDYYPQVREMHRIIITEEKKSFQKTLVVPLENEHQEENIDSCSRSLTP